MRKMTGMLALGLLLAFGTVTLSYAGDPTPAPAPTDDKTKKPSPSGPKVFASDEKKDEKKDDKGGK